MPMSEHSFVLVPDTCCLELLIQGHRHATLENANRVARAVRRVDPGVLNGIEISFSGRGPKKTATVRVCSGAMLTLNANDLVNIPDVDEEHPGRMFRAIQRDVDRQIDFDSMEAVRPIPKFRLFPRLSCRCP